jgi:hypothetical protein
MAEMMRKTLPQWRQRCSGFLYKKDSQDVLDGDWTPLDFLKAERELLKVSPFGKEAADAFEILVAILSKKDHLAEHGHPQYPLPKHCPWTAGWIYYCMGPIIHFAVQHLQEYGVEYFASRGFLCVVFRLCITDQCTNSILQLSKAPEACLIVSFSWPIPISFMPGCTEFCTLQ